jgi:hypothetical protein
LAAGLTHESVTAAGVRVSAQAIADFIGKPQTSEAVAEALDQLRASGGYDRILAGPFAAWNA